MPLTISFPRMQHLLVRVQYYSLLPTHRLPRRFHLTMTQLIVYESKNNIPDNSRFSAFTENELLQERIFTQKAPRTKHIRHIQFRGDKNNNKMERFN
jgi:hypothetical protein